MCTRGPRVFRGVMLLAATTLLGCDAAPREDAAPSVVNAEVARLALPARERREVTTVSDGDSFRCADNRRIRLLLLDAPEMSQTPFGVRARDALRSRMRRGDTVWLEYDVQREDRYGRTLAHAWTDAQDGTHLNLAMARDGWAVAVVFPPNVRHLEAIREAVGRARAERRGSGRTERSPASRLPTSVATADVT